MPEFSHRSLERLRTCHPDIRKVLKTAIVNGPDFTILCGHRGEEEQTKAFVEGRSSLKWPHSKHNQSPSRAVDVAPYPVDWSDIGRFRVVVSYILGVADALGVEMRSGGDWDRDWEESDEWFRDGPHLELLP